ncbi:hypothetical protein CEP54_003160 [Fusarium duplospermum]|uniref:Uncharacterized protein n=1 Tax=Fusarium duplospermum TaxID=1325734 RepID=A0A428QR31_9HYPO|nr:hypothetical protein CEP54_003160 [Fusarium duplospermum]
MTRPVLGSFPPLSRDSSRGRGAPGPSRVNPAETQRPNQSKVNNRTELLWWTLELHLINPYLPLRNTSATLDFAIIDTTLL